MYLLNSQWWIICGILYKKLCFQSLSTTVVQLFTTDGPEGTEWQYQNFGILSFVRDSNRRSYYYQLYCPIRHQLLWEHEMYNGLKYQRSDSFFHCFEAEVNVFTVIDLYDCALLKMHDTK